jgi:hypothetical protein
MTTTTAALFRQWLQRLGHTERADTAIYGTACLLLHHARALHFAEQDLAAAVLFVAAKWCDVQLSTQALMRDALELPADAWPATKERLHRELEPALLTRIVFPLLQEQAAAALDLPYAYVSSSRSSSAAERLLAVGHVNDFLAHPDCLLYSPQALADAAVWLSRAEPPAQPPPAHVRDIIAMIHNKA